MEIMQNPRVCIVIPVYNEIKFITKCLDSLIKNDYPKDKIEILIFDGGSSDGTLEILAKYQNKYDFIKVYNNPKKLQVFALNEEVKRANGEIIIRCDVHAEYPQEYIKTLVEFHKKNLADNIGGVLETLPGGETHVAKAIAIALKSKLGVGLSFRTMKNLKEPIYSDTVPFGSWKKQTFEKYGLFDENFARAEDFEYNVRIRKMGGKVLLIPWLRIKYYARESLYKLAKMSFQYGYAKILVLKKHKFLGNKRQLIPPLFVLSLPISVFIYIPLYTLISFILSVFNKDVRLTPFIFSSFFTMHLFYGIGYLKGIYDIFIKKRMVKEWEITR